MATKRKSLLSIVQEREFSKKRAEEEKRLRELKLIPYLPNDCVCNILLRLPIESLQLSRFVCRPWYRITKSPKFIETHLSTSENTVIFLTQDSEPLSQENPYTYSVEAKLHENEVVPLFQQPLLNPKSPYHMRYLQIRDGKGEISDYHATCMGKIRGCCNGLVLLDNKIKKGGLTVFNPVTRNILVLPLGTLFPPHEESYGLVYSPSTKQYKLIHIFRDKSQFVSCEILDIGTRSWRVVDGPSFGLFSWFGYNPVHAIAALHWVPHANHSDYIVSMDTENENFHSVPLPKSSYHNGIVEIGGFLGFVAREGMDQVDIWILRSLARKEWTKQHSIIVSLANARDIIPLCCTKINGEMLVRCERDSSLYLYDFHSGLVRKIEMSKGIIRSCFLFPHVNSLVSLQTHGEGEDMDY